jgi:hypothetical protein
MPWPAGGKATWPLSLRSGPLRRAPGLRRQQVGRWLPRDPSRGVLGCPPARWGEGYSSCLSQRFLSSIDASPHQSQPIFPLLWQPPANSRRRSPDPLISIAHGRLIAPETCHRACYVADGGADGVDVAQPIRSHSRINDACEGLIPSSWWEVEPSPFQPAPVRRPKPGAPLAAAAWGSVWPSTHEVASRTTKTRERQTTMHLL